MLRAIVCGGGGFIGGHLAARLKSLGYYVRICDLKRHEYFATDVICDEFIVGDLTDPNIVNQVIVPGYDMVFQLAADMGGAGYIFTGEHDADIMHNSALINLNVVHACIAQKIPQVFYSSSACIYPEHNQRDPNNPNCVEDSAYPANPDSEYGWEKIFSERLYLSYQRNYGLNVKIARFHNVFGPYGTWNGGREKAPAALCRKIAQAHPGTAITIWGNGEQTRSFLYVDECIDGILHLMSANNFSGPVNLGSEEMVSLNQLAKMIMQVADKPLQIEHISGPLGVAGRNSNNDLIYRELNWKPQQPLIDGLALTYAWIAEQITK